MIYFGYGANLDPLTMAERIPTAIPMIPAWIDGYVLTFEKPCSDGMGRSTIINTGRKRDRVYGAIYEVSYHGMQALDGYEGTPRHYQRTPLPVLASGGWRFNAWTYQAQIRKVGIEPPDWYVDKILAGIDYWRIPSGYRRKVLETANRF